MHVGKAQQGLNRCQKASWLMERGDQAGRGGRPGSAAWNIKTNGGEGRGPKTVWNLSKIILCVKTSEESGDGYPRMLDNLCNRYKTAQHLDRYAKSGPEPGKDKKMEKNGGKPQNGVEIIELKQRTKTVRECMRTWKWLENSFSGTASYTAMRNCWEQMMIMII